MAQEPMLAFATFSNESAAATQRRLACFTRAWMQFALDAMNVAASEVDVMRSFLSPDPVGGPDATNADNPATLCHGWVQDAKRRYEKLIVAQRSANDAMAKAAFAAWDTLADVLPERLIMKSAQTEVDAVKSTPSPASKKAA